MGKICLFSFLLLILNCQLSIINYPVFAADTVPPLTQAGIIPAAPDGSNGWYKSPLDITLAASDESSGVESINWRLDSGAWQSQIFSDTLNLAPNASFENVSGGQPIDWVFAGLPSSTGSSDPTNFFFGQKSVKIVSGENGWSGFNNKLSYIPSSPFANFIASVWIKTQNVVGSGAFFKIYALTPSGPLLIAGSQVTTGTNNFVRISKSFTLSASDAYGVYLDLGLSGVGAVWFDGVSINNSIVDTQVTNTFASPGSHTLEYYSLDNLQNEELPRKTLSFKIDSTAPSNWRGFGSYRFGNDHTLISQITVDDSTSGLNTSADSFQYSVDGGQNWGYYSNLLSCNSSWVANGWSSVPITIPPFNGSTTATLFTPPVNYCNSDWQVCKIIRFKESDLAGNESTKDVCINGAWIKVSGDVGANAGINFSAAAPQDNSDGVIVASGSVGNFSSSRGWLVQNYPIMVVPGYSSLLSQFPTVTSLPQGKLPAISGRFLVNSSYTISSSTIPSNYSAAQFSAVVFVNGNLTINSDLDISPGSALLFIVSGDVLVDKNVNTIEGQFIIDGKIDTSYNGNKGSALNLYGMVVANDFVFSRSLSQNADSQPSEQVIYQPKNLLNLPSVLGSFSVSWREVSP